MNASAMSAAPPDNELGVAVPLQLEIGRTVDLVFGALDFVVFSTGFLFTFTVRWRDLRMEVRDLRGLRLGIEFSDGATLTTVPFSGSSGPGEQLVLAWTWTDGRREMWVARLPSPGRLTLYCGWEAEPVAELRKDIDAQAVLDAAESSEVLWPEEPPQEPIW